jgi:lipopolysaccharide/colanic/teichoic acid biosynthesis glycosyltransferase
VSEAPADIGPPPARHPLEAVPRSAAARRRHGLLVLGPVSSARADELARRHRRVVLARHPNLPTVRPPGDFVDVLVDGDLLGPLGDSRPQWLDHVEHIFVLNGPDDDPMAPIGGPLGRASKRLLDVVAGTVALLLFAPVIAVAGLWVKLDSRGPAFYRHVRVGKDGRQFRMWKLRTMHCDADDAVHREYVKSLMRGEAARNNGMFRVGQDPRITRAGRVLRRWSIDELPQFVNVMSGDMSVVGPRPNALHETAMYDGTAWQRLRVRPGVTGPWQVDARGLVPFEEMIALDIRYIAQRSLFGDVRLIFRTPGAVLGGDGAA